MNISPQDKSILCQLAEKQAAIAARPIHKVKAKEWARLNGLRPGRPLVYIYQVPWWEFDNRDELKLECRDESCRKIERNFRYLIYQWEHFPADMVVEPIFYSHPVIHDTGFGIQEKSESILSNEYYTSRHYIPQITCEADIEKIKMPQITYDAKATEQYFHEFSGGCRTRSRECWRPLCILIQAESGLAGYRPMESGRSSAGIKAGSGNHTWLCGGNHSQRYQHGQK